MKLYLLDSDDSNYSHDRELNQSEYFTLVKDGLVSIKAIHMVVSLIYLKAKLTQAFGMQGYNSFLRIPESGLFRDPNDMDTIVWQASCSTSLFDSRSIPGTSGNPLRVAHVKQAYDFIHFQCIGSSEEFAFPTFCNSIGVKRIGRDKTIYRCIPLTFNTFLEKSHTPLGNVTWNFKCIGCECVDEGCNPTCHCCRYGLPCTTYCK